MHISRALALSFVTASLCLAAVPGAAQPTSAPSTMPAAMPMAPAAPPASSLIHVSSCTASLNLSQSGGYAGYAPGFYGGGYWGDPWGARYYSPPMTTTSPQMAVDWMNISPKVMKDVQFGLIANGILKAEARDVGTFSPNAEIKHKYGIPSSTFPLGTGLPQCVPLHIQFADGTKWRNPKLPPKNQSIYLHP
jgi:hypothetical protein